jgi:hypothetical protein
MRDVLRTLSPQPGCSQTMAFMAESFQITLIASTAKRYWNHMVYLISDFAA